jgi:hypothetical protein
MTLGRRLVQEGLHCEKEFDLSNTVERWVEQNGGPGSFACAGKHCFVLDLLGTFPSREKYLASAAMSG